MLRYAITPGLLTTPSGPKVDSLVKRCAELSHDGVDFLLVREKALPSGALTLLCRAIASAIAGSPTQLLVAGRIDVALAVGAQGVHLSSAPGELIPAQVRQLFPAAYVSISCHTLAEVSIARQNHADAILFAPIFGKQIGAAQIVPPAGLEALRAACLASASVPVFALGGVTSPAFVSCLQAGAAGVAGIRLFFPSS